MGGENKKICEEATVMITKLLGKNVVFLYIYYRERKFNRHTFIFRPYARNVFCRMLSSYNSYENGRTLALLLR